MIPDPNDLQYCIYDGATVFDGTHGLAIGATEQEAWARAISPAEDWNIERAKERGLSVRRCFIGVVNP